MMKRVNLSRFKPQEVSRRIQQCLRWEGVVANGESHCKGETCAQVQTECNCEPKLSEEIYYSEKCNEDHRNKNNLLNCIKRKWRNGKRNKHCESRTRSDSLNNVCQCHCENCKLRTCSKYYWAHKQLPHEKTNIWALPSSILKCQNNKNVKEGSVDSLVVGKNDTCSCFGTPKKSGYSEERNCTVASGTRLNNPSSCTNPCNSNHIASSPVYKNLFDIETCQINSEIDNRNTYESTTCSREEHKNEQTMPKVGNLTQELYKLSKYGWYWGPINRSEAESKLIDQPDGAFLVRDSSDDRYILSLSFRSFGKTLHTRIEHSNGLFSFYSQPEPEGHSSIIELIQQSMCYSQSGVFCYSRSRSPGSPSFPVRLTKPISRFTQVRSLQYLCRFVIRQFTRYDHIQKLPLPSKIKGYLEEGHY